MAFILFLVATMTSFPSIELSIHPSALFRITLYICPPMYHPPTEDLFIIYHLSILPDMI